MCADEQRNRDSSMLDQQKSVRLNADGDTKYDITMVSAANRSKPVDKFEYPLGSVIDGRYKVLTHIGAGGMGAVYKVEDQVMRGEPLALKTLQSTKDKSDKAAEEAIRRFQNEAKALASLRHPNVITVHHFGIPQEGSPYLVLEFIDGVGLAELISTNGRLPIDLTLDIAIQICAGLNIAREKQVLHRDLKPGNIMIECRDPKANDLGGKFVVKILDFGLAKMYSETTPKLTQTGHVVGSPAYMSPEQWRGQQLDERSDIYSLGCLIFECLTGQPPFHCPDVFAAVQAHTMEKPPTLTEASQAADFPETLEEFVARLLEKDPSKRHQTVMEVQLDLQNLRDNKPPIPATQAASKNKFPTREVKKDTFNLIAAVSLISAIAVIFIILLTGILRTPETETHTQLKPSADVTSLEIGTNEPSAKTAASGPFPSNEHKGDKWVKEQLEVGTLPDPLILSGKKKFPVIGGSNFTDEGLQNLQDSGLHGLDVQASNITDAGIKYLEKLPLTYINLSDTEISDRSLPSLARIKTLRDIVLNHTKVSSLGIQKLTPSLRKLDSLSLEQTDIDDNIQTSLAKSRYLKEVDLRNTKISDQGIEGLPQTAIGLRELYLANDAISDRGVSTISHLKFLMILDLAGTRITGQNLSLLAPLKDLRYLDLSNDQLDDQEFASFAKRPYSLHWLFLSHDKVSQKLMDDIMSIHELRFLDLSNTNLTDSQLLQLKNKIGLKQVVVSGSKVTQAGIDKFQAVSKSAQVVTRINPDWSILNHLGLAKAD